jgi:SNF2 family DNA or RNA helicase
MAQTFVGVPEIYPKLLELRQSKTASFKPNKYVRESTKLRYYQVVGALHMLLLNRMVLGDSCGLGKTLQIIMAYSFLLDQDPTLKLIVLCHKSAMYQWEEEFQKFTQGITTRVLTNEFEGVVGYQARKMQYSRFTENVLIINYNPILDEYEAIKQILGNNYMMVLDECVVIKNKKTKTHFACEQLALSAKRVYGLSATIIKNGLEEVWGIYAVIVPGLFGNITRFRTNFCQMRLMRLIINGKPRQIPKIVGYKNLKEFKTVLDPYFLIRRKEEVATELPKLMSRKVVLEMEDEQKQAYREALAGILYEEKIKQAFFEVSDKVRNGQFDVKVMELYNQLKEKYEKFLTPEGKKRGKLAALTYCQMVSNGPALVKKPGESSKENEFLRLMQDELLTEKVILFTRFASGIPFLEIICERNHIQYTKITGGENAKERDVAKNKFMSDPNCNIIFITTAGSESLNLQAASVVIFYDTPWSYGDLVQTIGRAQRIGSLREHILLIHMVNKGTIDVRVLNKVDAKKDLSDAILGNTAVGALDFTGSEDSIIDDLFEDIKKDAAAL